MTNPFEELAARLTRIENLLLEKSNQRPPVTETIADRFIDITQAAKIINRTVGSIYGLVHKGKIPHYKQGKRLYFLESELHLWIQNGRRQTVHEIQSEAVNSLSCDE